MTEKKGGLRFCRTEEGQEDRLYLIPQDVLEKYRVDAADYEAYVQQVRKDLEDADVVGQDGGGSCHWVHTHNNHFNFEG